MGYKDDEIWILISASVQKQPISKYNITVPLEFISVKVFALEKYDLKFTKHTHHNIKICMKQNICESKLYDILCLLKYKS